MQEKEATDRKKVTEEAVHLGGMHPAWMHTMMFIGVLSFSLTVLISLFSAF